MTAMPRNILLARGSFCCELLLMTRRAVSTFVCLLGFSLPLAAQQPLDSGRALSLSQPNMFPPAEASLLFRDPIALSDGRYFLPASRMRSMGMVSLDFGPAYVTPIETHRINGSPMNGTDAPDGVLGLRTNPIYAGGEAGVFYGKSSGKYGREDFATYIFGTIGNDNFRITVGATHQESTVRIPRR